MAAGIVITISILCVVLFIGILIALIAWMIPLYNGLVSLKNIVEEAWSGIDVQLKRRYDLVPNLVETVKGYAKHEQKTFENIAKFRSGAMNATSVEEKGKYENMLTGALKTLFAVAEDYPELQANKGFLGLQEELTKIEDTIQKARRYYNGTVRDFNTKIQMFPANLVASILGFKPYEFFEADEEERENVKVDFSNDSEDKNSTVEEKSVEVEKSSDIEKESEVSKDMGDKDEENKDSSEETKL